MRLRRLQDKNKPTEHISRIPRAYITRAHPSAHQVYINDYEDYNDYEKKIAYGTHFEDPPEAYISRSGVGKPL